MLGSPRYGGHSENAIACDPLAAHRRTSAAASSGSQSGISVSGISRSAFVVSPHQSSIIQSLNARTHSRPTFLSCRSMKICPQNRGTVGKQSETSVWLAAMSASRAVRS